MNNEPLEREPIDPCAGSLGSVTQGKRCAAMWGPLQTDGQALPVAAMPNGRGKSTGPRTMEGLERSRRATGSTVTTRVRPRRSGHACGRLDQRPRPAVGYGAQAVQGSELTAR